MKKATTKRDARTRYVAGLIATSTMATAIAVSCSVSDSSLKLGNGSDSAGSGGGFNGFDGGNGSGGNTLNEDSACATASDEAKLVPVNMYIMFDKSGSMQGTKWSQTSLAMETFFGAKESAGLRVALRFFPDDTCPDGNCNASSCMAPMVPLGELTNLSSPTDVQEQALLQALADTTPQGNTPMHPALAGAELWAHNYLLGAPFEKAVVVLVSDGDPTDCDKTYDGIVDLAAGAFTHDGVLTFAVGLEGSNETLMNGIAAAGGTTAAIFVDTANAEEQFLDALNAIKESTVACEFQMPEGTSDNPIDPTKVNVIYTPGDGGEDVIVGQVGGEGECTADKGGWYYDNAMAPTKITFCPSTCGAIQSDKEAQIEILLGCTTIPA